MTDYQVPITVFGANRSGIAIAKLLNNRGASVSVTDMRDADALSEEIAQLKGTPVQFFLGGHEAACIANAALIVVSPGVPLDIPILHTARQSGIPILGELEVSASLCQAPIVAITGTKGKSTTTLLTAAILKASSMFRKVAVAGNIGVPLANEVLTLTSDDIAVVEASSFQLESTETFRPAVSVVLNFSRDHLDRHGTMETYCNAKRKIYANQTDAEWIVLNADDATVSSFAEATAAQKVYFTDTSVCRHTYKATLQTGGDACTKTQPHKQTSRIGTRLKKNGNTIGIYANKNNREQWICDITDMPLAGAHNVRNALAAIAVGTIFGVAPAAMRQALVEFKRGHPALEHAFEKVTVINDVEFINDSKATNVIATSAALESIAGIFTQASTSKRVLLIIGGYDKGNDYAALTELVDTTVKGLVLLGAHTQYIEQTLAGCSAMWHAATMEDAVSVAYRHATPGDIVLLSPANASFDMYTDYKARGDAFKKAVKRVKNSDQQVAAGSNQ